MYRSTQKDTGRKTIQLHVQVTREEFHLFINGIANRFFKQYDHDILGTNKMDGQ